ncbi:MAG: hypothetical protein CVU36_21960 [Betaproteobacteria bacterium HGW-Betaproteobacteria-9]|jgi:prepilin peptidase CpaA|nr:MAG: hypothetical protein CVU36_21960 [Betaproteobacteria bacterium HGW-Betaproteobacteria-9]
MTSAASPAQWQAVVLALLAVLLTLAVWNDARHRRIPNTLVLVTLLAGLLFHALGPQAITGGLFSSEPSALGFWHALGGSLTGLLLFLPLHLLRILGAGDVKLFAAVGAFAGPAATVNLALCVLLAGGLLALGHMVMARNARLVMQNTLASLGQMLPGSAGSFDAHTQTAWRMPYAVAIALGVAGYAAWRLSGHDPILNF